jgi:hypothetical protein
MARGSLRPVIYFERGSDKYVILPPAEEGGGVEMARMCYEQRYRHEWAWREAGTLNEVDALQKRLAAQGCQEAEKRVRINSGVREQIYRETGANLRSRMVSESTSPWERDFIKAYLALREDKRDKYRDALLHHNYYIYAREQDAGRKVEDLMRLEPGQFERSGVS